MYLSVRTLSTRYHSSYRCTAWRRCGVDVISNVQHDELDAPYFTPELVARKESASWLVRADLWINCETEDADWRIGPKPRERQARHTRHLQLRLNAYLVYYNLVRPHLSLKTTPACSAGLTDHAWTWEELLTFRLRPDQLAAVVGG
jgi:hypothetical protein